MKTRLFKRTCFLVFCKQGIFGDRDQRLIWAVAAGRAPVGHRWRCLLKLLRAVSQCWATLFPTPLAIRY
ncbi:MAG: hypothetical protein QNJ65_00315 [Xenococcaceae cyanobacterium MO_234.B1]|nr:hypothetical protein [Xenococcaceae cyanobacterium MO_234.B1]